MLDGQNLAGVPPYRRPTNMMFQSYALFPHMNVEANIAFGLKQDRMPKPEIEARVAEMLRLVKLTPFAKRKPHQLSGGQRQRVALARSLAKKPKVLLLDEPLAALDKKLREETQFELIELQQTLGLTFLIVTHDQEEAMTVADRIAVMNHGRIIQVATPAEIYEQPNSRYVADFIGDINLLEGSIQSTFDRIVKMECAGTGAVVEVDQEMEAQKGEPAWFAIRPEKVAISLDPAGETARSTPSRARSGTSAISATSRSTTCGCRPAPRSSRPSPTAPAWSSGRSPGTTRSGSPGRATAASC